MKFTFFKHFVKNFKYWRMVFRKTAINHGGLWYQNSFIWSFLMFWQPLSCQLYHSMTLYRLRNSKVSKVVKITVFKHVQVCGKTTYGFKAVYTVFEWCYILVPFFFWKDHIKIDPKNLFMMIGGATPITRWPLHREILILTDITVFRVLDFQIPYDIHHNVLIFSKFNCPKRKKLMM